MGPIESTYICRFVVLTFFRQLNAAIEMKQHKRTSVYYKRASARWEELAHQICLACVALEASTSDEMTSVEWQRHFEALVNRVIGEVAKRNPDATSGQVIAQAAAETMAGEHDGLFK